MSSLFAKYYDLMMAPIERNRFIPVRIELLSHAEGEVLELGSGTGINFQYYKNVSVTALEPNEHMQAQSLHRKLRANVPIQLINGSAESLPFDDNSFDTVVGTLVFCTFPDPIRALQEIKRVCKPKGKILLFEHVRVDHKLLGGVQDLLTPLWKKMCDGCHLNRDTYQLIKHMGFEITKFTQHFNNIFITVQAANTKEI